MAQPHTQTNNPLERKPIALPENRRTKSGPGARYTPASRVGPAVVSPQVNRAAQSARSSALENGSPTINRAAGTNAREVSRSALAEGQTGTDLYGDFQ
jgi:hypothetical protein